MRAHKIYDTDYVVGVFRPDGSHIYMTWDGCGNYGDSYSPMCAEKFDSAKEARDYLRKDSKAREWFAYNPEAKVLQMVSRITVYPPR